MPGFLSFIVELLVFQTVGGLSLRYEPAPSSACSELHFALWFLPSSRHLGRSLLQQKARGVSLSSALPQPLAVEGLECPGLIPLSCPALPHCDVCPRTPPETPGGEVDGGLPAGAHEGSVTPAHMQSRLRRSLCPPSWEDSSSSCHFTGHERSHRFLLFCKGLITFWSC